MIMTKNGKVSFSQRAGGFTCITFTVRPHVAGLLSIACLSAARSVSRRLLYSGYRRLHRAAQDLSSVTTRASQREEYGDGQASFDSRPSYR